jgi:hypothetical protein
LVIANVTRYVWVVVSPAGAGLGFVVGNLAGGVEPEAVPPPPVLAAPPDPPEELDPVLDPVFDPVDPVFDPVFDPAVDCVDVVAVDALVGAAGNFCWWNGSRPRPFRLERAVVVCTLTAGTAVAGEAALAGDAGGCRVGAGLEDLASSVGTATRARISTSATGHRRFSRSSARICLR